MPREPDGPFPGPRSGAGQDVKDAPCIEWALTLLGVWLLCRGARCALLTPLRLGGHIRLSVLLRVDGEAPELKEAVDTLAFLRWKGVLPGEIVLRDDGMDERTRLQAEKLAGEVRGVKLWKRETSSNS